MNPKLKHNIQNLIRRNTVIPGASEQLLAYAPETFKFIWGVAYKCVDKKTGRELMAIAHKQSESNTFHVIISMGGEIVVDHKYTSEEYTKTHDEWDLHDIASTCSTKHSTQILEQRGEGKYIPIGHARTISVTEYAGMSERDKKMCDMLRTLKLRKR